MASVLGQLSLAPDPQAGRHPPRRLPFSVWREILADRAVEGRYRAAVLRLRPGDCFPWLGTISSSGAGSLYALPSGVKHMVSAHQYGYQLEHGPLAFDAEAGEWPVVRHACDEPYCQNPEHWLEGTTADNLDDWLRRRWRPGSPLSDLRGPRGRAAAVREAARAALAAGLGTAEIAAAVREAAGAGMPGGQDTLF